MLLCVKVENIIFMMEILLSQNVRCAENLYSISRSLHYIIRIYVNGFFPLPAETSTLAKIAFGESHVSQQINNRFNESRVDKLITRHAVRHSWRMYEGEQKENGVISRD